MKKSLAILMLMGSTSFAQTPKKITLEDIFQKGTFDTKTVTGLRSLNDGKTYVSIETNPETHLKYVARNNYSDGKTIGAIFSEKDLFYKGRKLPVSTNFNKDERKVIIADEEEAIYRRSSKANYYVFDIATKKITEVSPNGKQLFATISPDGNKVAFVRDNNLYIKDLNTEVEEKITQDGEKNNIINGGTDWVYEEEFSFAKAFFWSPDSKSIAYYKFNETNVPVYSMTIYEKLYPTEYQYKYPKPGEKNAIVSIHLYDTQQKQTKTVDIGEEKDQYIPRIKWTQDPNILCVFRMNRHQNKLEYLFADAKTGNTKVILTEENKYYININDDLTFLQNGKQFIHTSELDGFNHLYLYDISGKMIRQITKGNWEITKLYGVNEESSTLYYQSTESSPLQRDIYAVQINGKNKRKLSHQPGTNNATFSTDFSYYILNHSSAKSPAYITLHDRKGKLVRILEDNNQAKTIAQEYGIKGSEFFQFTTSSGIELNGYMVKPVDFDPTKKYPVLMYVYGGPGSQNVADSWSGSRSLWFSYLAQQGYIVACVDNRGTGFRGQAFQKCTYLNLGKLETEDQIEGAKWLAKQSFIDPDRIGIWGWSYGGYMSSLCITKGADIFKLAIAVAPVTTWRYYDSIYTERYLRTPQENAEGYDQNSPINFADRLKGKFLLIHGTGDDNVHFQNSIMFSEALIQANKPFEQAYYPNKNHGIYGGNTSLHLYNKMTAFVLENL
ncbi:S9 family peptidase [Olivibacter domesticus]|uniref:Dipeptidyl-peptidase-4 n=1 Tax=Olivibacter domesticus TaxID=407022 RepID=A0A1H7WZH8_OLID1|nr:S9 family peptidase [Olivibacter domesticus]SEM27012.1 dipeptidyl-peptidase-4 [Olivibacter domesticus]